MLYRRNGLKKKLAVTLSTMTVAGDVYFFNMERDCSHFQPWTPSGRANMNREVLIFRDSMFSGMQGSWLKCIGTRQVFSFFKKHISIYVTLRPHQHVLVSGERAVAGARVFFCYNQTAEAFITSSSSSSSMVRLNCNINWLAQQVIVGLDHFVGNPLSFLAFIFLLRTDLWFDMHSRLSLHVHLVPWKARATNTFSLAHA